MQQGDVGYLRHAPESREFLVKEATERRGEIGGKAGGRFGLDLRRGVDVPAEAEGKLSKDVKTDRKEIAEFSEISNLVTFLRKEPGTNAMEWIIENVDERKGLFSAVIHERDSYGGRLGTLNSRTKGGWAVQPVANFEPYAEIVNEQELTAATRTNIVATKTKSQKEVGRKLGIRSALVGRELDHVMLDPLVMPNEGDDE